MANGIEFNMRDAGEISRSIEKAARDLPHSTEVVLKREARRIAKDLRSEVSRDAEGEHWVAEGEKDTRNPKHLKDSFRAGKVVRSGKKTTVAVTTKAGHYHLYEDGHDIYTHNKKNKNAKGKEKILYGRRAGRAERRKTVARYMAIRSEYSELIGKAVLEEILEEAGLNEKN